MAFDKLSKVYALYKKGSSEGEKRAALGRLLIMLQAVNMTLEQYEEIHGEGQKKPFVYSFVGQFERDLLAQVYYMVTEGKLHSGKWFEENGSFVEFEMTEAEKLDFDIHWYTYRNAFIEECRLLYSAFVNKNNIFPEVLPDWAKNSGDLDQFKDEEEEKKDPEEEKAPEPDVREHRETNTEFSMRSAKEQMKLMMLAQIIDRVAVRRQLEQEVG